MSAKKKAESSKGHSSSIAKSDDGTVQITFTIPFEKIKKAREMAAKVLGKDIEVPGFRKGKAPLKNLLSHIPQNTLLESTLSSIIPKLLSEAIKKYSIVPAVYPKFELIKAEENHDWQVRAITCEMPSIKLGEYKKAISSINKGNAIWTPDKQGSGKKEEKLSTTQKEQEVIRTLLKVVEINVPKVLIDEETNARLSSLLQRLEKLGLTLESYLSSIRKDSTILRNEYEKQAKDSISIDLILNAVADKESITVSESDIDNTIKVTDGDATKKAIDKPDQRRLIKSVLRRRKVLEKLVSLI